MRRVRPGLLSGLLIRQPPVYRLGGAQVPPLDDLDHLESLVVEEQGHLRQNKRAMETGIILRREMQTNHEGEGNVCEEVPKHVRP